MNIASYVTEEALWVLAEDIRGIRSDCRWLVLVFLLVVASSARAQIHIDIDQQRSFPGTAKVVADLDDDDENGQIDARENAPGASDELATLTVSGGSSSTRVRVEGAVRLAHGSVFVSEAKLDDVPLFIQGTSASERANDARIVIEDSGKLFAVPITVIGIRFVNGTGHPLDPGKDALAISRRITHDASLPRAHDANSTDADNLRVEISDPSRTEATLFASVLSVKASGDRRAHLRHVPLTRVGTTSTFRSPVLRLVADETDLSAPEVRRQLLLVGLRDQVRVSYGTARAELHQDMRVGRPGREGGPSAALIGTLRLTIVRFTPKGPPVVGDSDEDAIELAREQIEIANEIWAQCGIGFGDPRVAPVAVVDPPPPALLAVSDVDGLPAFGGGEISFVADGVNIGPVKTRAGQAPETTALAIALALRARGFKAEISINPRAEQGALPSADVVVRNARGEPVTLSEKGPISTDRRQRVSIGRVDLSDGIQEFDNMLASAGTIEERTLVKLLADNDPRTIDIIVVNHFMNPQRQGEAFIEADGSALANTLIVDRNAVRFQRQAWVQAHELGHVLLDEAFHPDNVGTDRPWLLMDADARQGRVTGPKRLSAEECEKVRRRSGPGAVPALLVPAP